jgi:hypothetical protein
MHRQVQQYLPLGPEGFAHAASVVFGPAPVGGRALAPASCLGVEVGQVGEGARGEEALAHVADRALHPARLVAMVGGERQQRRVEADGVALAFEHGALEVVVEQHPGDAAEGLEGFYVSAQEAVHAGVHEEAQEYLARVAELHPAACAQEQSGRCRHGGVYLQCPAAPHGRGSTC